MAKKPLDGPSPLELIEVSGREISDEVDALLDWCQEREASMTILVAAMVLVAWASTRGDHQMPDLKQAQEVLLGFLLFASGSHKGETVQ